MLACEIGIALDDAARRADRLPVLAHELSGGNVARREPIARCHHAADGDDEAVTEGNRESRGDLGLGDRHVVAQR